MRHDFAHQTSYAIASNPNAQLIGFEKLNNTGMVKKPKLKQDALGRYVRNYAKQKAGLNKAILSSVWGSVLEKTKYKARRRGKLVVEVKANHSSQECSACGDIHAENRKTQSLFSCLHCGYSDNADSNAAQVIAKRAVALLRDGIASRKKRSRSVRRKTSNTVGMDMTEPLSSNAQITPLETMSDAMVANAVIAQSSVNWETATTRPRL